MYPVEIRYRPLQRQDVGDDGREADDEEAMEEAIVDAARGPVARGPGDILVFLPGEREIRETAELCVRRWRGDPTRSDSKSCRCSRGCRSPTSSACSRPATGAGSCSPPTWRRRR